MRTIPAAPGSPTDTDPVDDWLAAGPELDWFQEPAESPNQSTRGSRLGRPRSERRASTPLGSGFSAPDQLMQRRLIAGGVLAAIVVAAIIVIVLASGGGGSKTPAATQTNQVTTTPVTTTKTTGGTKTQPATTHVVATPKVTLPKAGLLKSGDTGAQVKTLQQALRKLGVLTAKADGNFGAITAKAVSTFQTQHALTSDGVVGAKTAQAINAALKG